MQIAIKESDIVKKQLYEKVKKWSGDTNNLL